MDVYYPMSSSSRDDTELEVEFHTTLTSKTLFDNKGHLVDREVDVTAHVKISGGPAENIKQVTKKIIKDTIAEVHKIDIEQPSRIIEQPSSSRIKNIVDGVIVALIVALGIAAGNLFGWTQY